MRIMNVGKATLDSNLRNLNKLICYINQISILPLKYTSNHARYYGSWHNIDGFLKFPFHFYPDRYADNVIWKQFH